MKYLFSLLVISVCLLGIGGQQNADGQKVIPKSAKKDSTDSIKQYIIIHDYGTMAASMDSIIQLAIKYSGTSLTKDQYLDVQNIYIRCYNRIIREGKIDSVMVKKETKK